jgi:hypothetical protein
LKSLLVQQLQLMTAHCAVTAKLFSSLTVHQVQVRQMGHCLFKLTKICHACSSSNVHDDDDACSSSNVQHTQGSATSAAIRNTVCCTFEELQGDPWVSATVKTGAHQPVAPFNAGGKCDFYE